MTFNFIIISNSVQNKLKTERAKKERLKENFNI